MREGKANAPFPLHHYYYSCAKNKKQGWQPYHLTTLTYTTFGKAINRNKYKTNIS